ncbi:hypothetical protein H4582DRAFT_2086560 [Lactarius indigo]|nr:hypothetical protein H4582DRAFT_2086560 [Lactarius indigo]
MSADIQKQRKQAIASADEEPLAELGYKQEFRRAFKPIEHRWSLAIYRVCPGSPFPVHPYQVVSDYSSVLLYSLPNGGPAAMVWGWAVASFFIFIVGLSVAELASAAPTSGGMLAASRQSFAFARDGALPFSSWLYRMNALGALVFAGTQVVNAVFAISVTALYVTYSIAISSRWIWRKVNGWTPGAFSLGVWMMSMSIVFFFPTTKHMNAEEMNYTVVVLSGVLILLLVWFHFPVYGGVHWFKGPVRTVEGHVTRKWATGLEQDVKEGGTDSIDRAEAGDAVFF